MTQKTQTANKLLDRFIRYAKIWSTSDTSIADNGKQPSTPQQLDFAHILAKEIESISANSLSFDKNATSKSTPPIVSIETTEYGYVYARIPATTGYEDVPSIGFLAHIDTVDEVSGKNVNPQIFREYNGGIIKLNESVSLDPSNDKFLFEAGQVNDTIITSDGSTLLGADDKAGIAEIMTAIEELLETSTDGNNANFCIPHGQIEIIFSPDEETGHGMDNVPLDLIQSRICFTLDGGHQGELEIECFNAYKSVITFNGKAKHTGTARPDMVNAITMASSFISMLPRHESPETTDGYQGFYALMNINGSIEKSSLTLFIRDFSSTGMEKRLETVSIIAKAVEASFTGSSVSVVNTKQYCNMNDKLKKQSGIIQNLKKAAESLGIEPVFPPIRGGTDGSRLTEMGIPSPNIFTGGHNFHSRTEWASLSQMGKAKDFILELIKLYSKAGDVK